MTESILFFAKRFMARLKVLLPVSVRQAVKPAVVFVFQKFLMLFPVPKVPVIKSINGVLFEFAASEDIYTKQMYLGLYEEDVRHALREILRPGDMFLDVGAGIGYISAFGAGLVGKKGEVHSFEPVPQNFLKLKKFAEMNRGYKIFLNQFALGDRNGEVVLYITKEHAVNNSIVRDFLLPGMIETTIVVPVRRLDGYIKEKGLRGIRLIKIDVEGYEFPVLKGLEKFFLEGENLPFIICEICPPTAPLLGHTVQDLLSYMERFSYRPFDLFNFNMKLDRPLIERQHSINVLFKPSK